MRVRHGLGGVVEALSLLLVACSWNARSATSSPPGAAKGAVLRLDSASEKAVTLLRRPVVIKVDEAGCEDCGSLDQFWGMAGAALPTGSVWRVDCGDSGGRFALCSEGRLTGRPRFEAWNGELFLPYAGLHELEALRDWIFSALKPPDTPHAAEPPSMGTLFVSPTVGGGAGDHKINFNQFQAYSSAYPAIVRAFAPYVDKTASIVDVGCGHGMLVEAWRAGHTNSSYGVEGSSDVVHTWPREHVDQFYRVLDLTDAGATLPPTDFVQTFEVAEHLPPEHAGHFVRMLTHRRPRLIFFGAATANQDQGRNPLHVNENSLSYWVEKFAAEGYTLDAARSAEARAALLADVGYQQALQTRKAWWYVKNALVFANVAVMGREKLDTALANAPESVMTGYFERLYRAEDEAADVARAMAMLYESMYDAGPLGPMWRRDWDEFSSLYIAERTAALTRIRMVGNAEQTLGAEKLADNKDKPMQGKVAARDQLEGHLRSLKNQVQAAMAAITAGVEWLDENQNAKPEQYMAQKKSVNDVVTPIISAVYSDVAGTADKDGREDRNDQACHHEL